MSGVPRPLRSFGRRGPKDLAEGGSKARSEVRAQLMHEPLSQTPNRKLLRPNRLATWELRAGDPRIFYDVDEDLGTVLITAVGVKIGSRLTIRGKELDL